MADFDIGTQCMVIASGRIGLVTDSTRKKVTLYFYDDDSVLGLPIERYKKVVRKTKIN